MNKSEKSAIKILVEKKKKRLGKAKRENEAVRFYLLESKEKFKWNHKKTSTTMTKDQQTAY